MNKSESKYFHTALRMNEALISLLEKKDLEFITVKEICETAGVNRSTFYLHYETISDLMNETVEMVDKRLLSYFSQRERDVLSEMNGADLKELVLVSRAYLLPYLRFIRDNKHVYRPPFAILPVCRHMRDMSIWKTTFLARSLQDLRSLPNRAAITSPIM